MDTLYRNELRSGRRTGVKKGSSRGKNNVSRFQFVLVQRSGLEGKVQNNE